MAKHYEKSQLMAKVYYWISDSPLQALCHNLLVQVPVHFCSWSCFKRLPYCSMSSIYSMQNLVLSHALCCSMRTSIFLPFLLDTHFINSCENLVTRKLFWWMFLVIVPKVSFHQKTAYQQGQRGMCCSMQKEIFLFLEQSMREN